MSFEGKLETDEGVGDKSQRTKCSIWITIPQFVFLNKLRSKMILNGERKHTYEKVMELLIHNYKINHGED